MNATKRILSTRCFTVAHVALKFVGLVLTKNIVYMKPFRYWKNRYLLHFVADPMLKELQQESRNVIKTYKDLVPELHKGLLQGIDIFETELLSKEETLKDASTFADLQEKHESFTKIKSKLESSAENYLPHLRQFDGEVKQLIQTLNETLDV
ncbi:unnamed protein product, partial [Mesorhabditis belari]|uniref:Uncharacterized protein n=1 Tax=Mesorhabditis belari TaxID=2138241 RepID=A0AAF3J8G5_9BILA